MRRECKQGGRGLREAPGFSQTREAPDGPSKLMRIKEKIFLRFAVFTLHQGVRGEAADQTGGPNPAKSHVEEFFLNFDLQCHESIFHMFWTCFLSDTLFLGWCLLFFFTSL